MSDVIISIVLFVLIYCTAGFIQLAWRLFLMKNRLETILAEHKDFDDEFKKGFFSGLLCFYTTYFNSKKFLETLDKN